MTLITIQEAAKIMGINVYTLIGRVNRAYEYNFPKAVGDQKRPKLYSETAVREFNDRYPVFIRMKHNAVKRPSKNFVYDGDRLQILLFLQPKLSLLA